MIGLRRLTRLVGGGDAHDDPDAGTAIIEFVFVAVLVMVPLVYLIVAVASVQRSSLAVSNAAREAGRAFATADSTADGLRRAQVAARLAASDQGIAGVPEVCYVAAGAGCTAALINPGSSRARYSPCAFAAPPRYPGCPASWPGVALLRSVSMSCTSTTTARCIDDAAAR